VVTASRLKSSTSAAIDEEVRTAQADGSDLYTIDTALIEQLRPDVIFTQDVCSVCAISAGTVRHPARLRARATCPGARSTRRALAPSRPRAHSRGAQVHRAAAKMVPPPRVVALNPADLEGVLADVLAVGAAVGLEVGARAARAALQARIDAAAADARAARGAAQRGEAPSVAFIEWADPIYVGGHWTPQLIEMAGGAHPLNPAGRGGDAGAGAGKSFAVAPDAVEASSPDVLVVCPCGTVCIPL
jgi:iron complex transport system substrate-binding protein